MSNYYQNNNGQWNQNNNRNYNNQNNNNQNQPQYKKSGASYTPMRGGKLVGEIAVNAWKITKNGIVKASAFPVDGKVHAGQKNDFMRYVVTVTQGIATETYWCLMNLTTKKIVIKELGLVISPNGSGHTRSGKKVTGFFGRNFKS